MAQKVAVCNKCGKKYPRWRSESRAVCETIVSTKNGFKRCCGSIVKAPDSKEINAYEGYKRLVHSGGVEVG